MDTKELRKLIEFISRSDFTEFELEQEGFRLKLSRASRTAPSSESAGAMVAPALGPENGASASGHEGPALVASPGASNGVVEVRSPIVGTFYRAAAPEARPFVEVGDRVQVGQVLCIVEAMKLMNEIQAEVAGEVVEVVPANAQPVEYDEVLFRVRPTA